MASRKSHFRDLWLSNPDFAPWLQRMKDKNKGYCKLCKKEVDFARMGTSALRSHMKSKQHEELRSCVHPHNQSLFFSEKETRVILFVFSLVPRVHHHQMFLNSPVT